MEKYTVIIPTRDRAETLAATIRSCLRQTYENFEIVVSDNFSSDNTKEIVFGFKDSRIRYINPGKRLSMARHFEYALEVATEGFVMFIGSDDGLMPDAINFVDSIVKKFDVKAVSCRQATFVWPNFPDTELAGRLSFGDFDTGIEIRQSNNWISKALNFQCAYCFELPNLYCGFVHSSVIKLAYSGGLFFNSITPDAYSAFATAVFLNRYAFSLRPFVIAGASGKSNGAASLHVSADKAEADKFNLENDIELANGFVNCPSFEVALGEAFASLAQRFPEKCLPYRLNYKAMLHNAILNANDKTKDEVTRGVEVMMENFSLRMEHKDVFLNHVNPLHSKIWRVLKILFFRRNRIIQVVDSTKLGVRDVDDAALVAEALICRSDSTNMVSTKLYYFRRFRRFFSN